MDTIVAFVTDSRFHLPSPPAAKQLARQNIHYRADIVIFTVGIGKADLALLSESYRQEKITFVDMDPALFTTTTKFSFRKSHIPVAALGRLSIQNLIPNAYENVIYIDGDVQIVGDVADLINTQVPLGMLLAGRGAAWLNSPYQNEDNMTSGYLHGLGDISPDKYFNSGVMAGIAASFDGKN